MSADWQVGDLAWQDNSLPYCPSCEAIPDDSEHIGDAPKGVLTVVGISPPNWLETRVGLIFAESDDGPWCSCIYRKVVRDERKACEPEFVTLLKRSKRRVEA